MAADPKYLELFELVTNTAHTLAQEDGIDPHGALWWVAEAVNAAEHAYLGDGGGVRWRSRAEQLVLNVQALRRVDLNGQVDRVAAAALALIEHVAADAVAPDVSRWLTPAAA